MHTAGPWRVAPDGVTIHQGPPEDPIIVGTADVDDVMAIDDDTEREANARLFAAAPDLLAWLEVAVKHWGWCLQSAGPTERDDFAAAEKAIARAKGLAR